MYIQSVLQIKTPFDSRSLSVDLCSIMIFNTIVLFFLIFCFPLAGALNSAYVAVLLAAGKIVFKNRTNSLQCIASNTYVRNLLLLTIGVTGLCACWTIGFGVYDFSLTKAYLSLFVGIIFTIVVMASLWDDLPSCDVVERLIVNVFFIQGLVSIVAFICPPVREFIHHFQFSSDVELAKSSYDGIRGLALSGRLFFEFSATCAIVTFIQFKRIISFDKVPYIEVFKLIVIILCGFFAGRTSLVGIGFGFIYLLACRKAAKDKFRALLRIMAMVMVLAFMALIFLPKDTLDLVLERLLPWVFDLFIKYFETGNADNSYAFHAVNDFYRNVSITPQEWWIGAGRYFASNGTYYKEVDAGYLRQILYWGLLGSIVSTGYALCYFIRPMKCATSRDNKLFIGMIFLMTMIFQYKGDLASISRFYHVVLLLLFVPSTLQNNSSCRINPC